MLSLGEAKEVSPFEKADVHFPSRRRPASARPAVPTFLRSLLLSQLRTARLLVLRPVQPLVLRAAVHHGATAGAVSELFDRLLRLGAGGEGAVAQPVLGDVLALPGFKLGNTLLVVCNSSLQHTTRLQHVAYRVRTPFAENGSAKVGLVVLRGQVFFDQRINTVFDRA